MKRLDPLTRLESLYQQTLDGLDAVRRVGEILGETFDEKQICERAVEIFVESLPFENCSILLLDSARKRLRLRAASGKSDDRLSDDVRGALNKTLEIPVGEGIAGQVVATGEPILITNAGRNPQFKPLPSPIPIRSLLCLPIHSKNDIIGVINLSHPEIEEISIDQEKTLEVLSRMVGQCITISRLSSDLISERLRRSERLITLGQLSASVAHEVNNPLTNILLRAQRLQSSEGLSDRDREMACEIQEESERIATILRNILDFSRARSPETRPSDIHESIHRTLALTVPLHAEKSKIKIERDLSEDLPLGLVDPHELEQVFTNLVINAIHAMDGKGHLRISTSERAGQIDVRFRDDGCGMDDEQMEQIFEPFYTTRGDSGGTGLGLAVCRQIVQSYSGELTVESEPGKGSTFCVTIPAVSECEPVPTTASRGSRRPGPTR